MAGICASGMRGAGCGPGRTNMRRLRWAMSLSLVVKSGVSFTEVYAHARVAHSAGRLYAVASEGAGVGGVGGCHVLKLLYVHH